MENRRQDYRHAFPPPARIAVELLRAGTRVPVEGEIVNLSVGGMGVELKQAASDTAAGRWLARFTVPLEQTPLSIPARLVHAANACSCGFQFLPLVDSIAHEHRERLIGRYLLEEQRQARKNTKHA